MFLPAQDGVAEDAALLQSDPLPVTDVDPMEGDDLSYHVEGLEGTKRVYMCLKRPKAAVK
jgi:hypothetical protein